MTEIISYLLLYTDSSFDAMANETVYSSQLVSRSDITDIQSAISKLNISWKADTVNINAMINKISSILSNETNQLQSSLMKLNMSISEISVSFQTDLTQINNSMKMDILDVNQRINNMSSSMFPGWPDAIGCTVDGAGLSIYYLTYAPNTNNNLCYYRCSYTYARILQSISNSILTVHTMEKIM